MNNTHQYEHTQSHRPAKPSPPWRVCAASVKAALELGVTASALSHTQNAGNPTGNSTAEPNPRSVSPTEAGQQLLTRLAPALVDIASRAGRCERIPRLAHGHPAHQCPRAAAQWVLAPLVSQFLIDHPGMRVEIVSDDALSTSWPRGFDAGVRSVRAFSDMVAVPQPSQRFVVVASPDFVARHGRPKHRATCSAFRACGPAFPSGGLLQVGVHQAPTNIGGRRGWPPGHQ